MATWTILQNMKLYNKATWIHCLPLSPCIVKDFMWLHSFFLFVFVCLFLNIFIGASICYWFHWYSAQVILKWFNGLWKWCIGECSVFKLALCLCSSLCQCVLVFPFLYICSSIWRRGLVGCCSMKRRRTEQRTYSLRGKKKHKILLKRVFSSSESQRV